MNYEKLAVAVGFDAAKIIPVTSLETAPSYRKLCEENVCGNYNLAWGCPPKCGSVEFMINKMNQYQNALILQKVYSCEDMLSRDEQVAIQIKHNKQTEVLRDLINTDGIADILFMSAGPWKKNSCLSAFCINCEKMAETAGMDCWEEDGNVRYFSLLLY